MASAQAPSGPAAFTDNDMTLPWDDLPNDQQGLFPTGSAAQGSDAALNTASRVSEASPEPEKPAMETTVLPETQVNDLPNDLPVNIGSPELPSGPQDIAFAEPTQVVSAPTHLKGEPTQLIGEPTQLALPAHPVAVAPAALPGSHSGTALASAAAQAMTGAHPSQASALPASGGFPTAMPSLALPQAAAQSPAGSALAQNSGPDQVTSVSLPISRPQADAVLHLPSQPSGSQHAAHPHGAPRGVAHGGSRAAKLPDSQVSQLQQQFQPGEYSHQEQRQQHLAPPKTVQRAPAAAAGAESSDHNTLLDSVLGHDDDDSIWMPPAFLPDSEGPTAAAQPASLPAGGGRTMPPDLHVPTAGRGPHTKGLHVSNPACDITQHSAGGLLAAIKLIQLLLILYHLLLVLVMFETHADVSLSASISSCMLLTEQSTYRQHDQITKISNKRCCLAGALEGSAPAAPAVPKPVQQASDSDQTQDSDRQPGAQQDSHEDAAGPTSALPPAKDRPTKQGNASRALPHAEEGMYTGAFAFPDSASLEVSQPALDLPHKSGRARRTTAAKAAAEGKTIKAAAAAAVGEAEKEAAPAVMHARAAKDASGASTSSSTGAATTGGSTKGRVMPSGWKRKKADPVADGTGSTSPEAAADAAPAPTGPAAAPAGPPTAAPAGLSAAAPAGVPACCMLVFSPVFAACCCL